MAIVQNPITGSIKNKFGTAVFSNVANTNIYSYLIYSVYI